MRVKAKSLRIRLLLPVIAIALFVVTLLTSLFSRAFITMILQQEQGVNEATFDTISRTITPLINTSVNEVRSIMSDDRVAGYTRLQYSSMEGLIHARISCRDYIQTEIERSEGVLGLLIMRQDGSIFGALPEANLFLDDPKDNPLPEDIKEQILSVPHGQMGRPGLGSFLIWI